MQLFSVLLPGTFCSDVPLFLLYTGDLSEFLSNSIEIKMSADGGSKYTADEILSALKKLKWTEN